MDDGQHRQWGQHKPLPLGPSARRLTRAEVARCFPGVPISAFYGVPRSFDAAPIRNRRNRIALGARFVLPRYSDRQAELALTTVREATLW